MKKGARLRVQGIRYRELCDFFSVLYPAPCTLYLVPQFFRILTPGFLLYALCALRSALRELAYASS
jgi:hypothetical protein